MSFTIRPFEDRDYERLAEIGTAIDAAHGSSADLLRERSVVHDPRIRGLHLAAEDATGRLVGGGRVTHIPWNYNPRNYLMRLEVDPAWQRRGVGSLLLDRLLAELRTWDAALVRGETLETRPDAVAFLEHRGFREWRRRWESVLNVADANTASLRSAEQRAASSGVSFTTYLEAQTQRGDRLAREIWELEDNIFRADRANAAEGEGMSFEQFLATEINWSEALPEAHFLAFVGDRLVGVSRLARDQDREGTLDQAFTGTHPEFRGRGIAQALKLRTIEFAREHGYRGIRTSNDSTNAPMLHINAAIGFRRGVAILVFERKLAD